MGVASLTLQTKNNNNKKIQGIHIGVVNTCYTVGPGCRRLRQWGRDGETRVTPFLTCPHSMPAPNRIILPPANLSKTQHPPSSGDSGIPGGRRPSSTDWLDEGILEIPRQGSPSPPGAIPIPDARNSSASLAALPGIPDLRVQRASRAPLSIRDSEARGELPPPPPPRPGATAHVSPLAQSGLSLRLQETKDPERVGQSRGRGSGRIRFTLPWNRRGRGRRPLL